MIGGDAELADAFAVLLGGIACVVVPTVVRVLFVKLQHEIVATGFGQNAGGGDREVFAIALDDGLIIDEGIGFETIAVDDDKFGAKCQGIESTVHGKDRGVENVDFVDFTGRNFGDGPSKSIAFYLFAQLITHLCRELLAIVETRVLIVGRENDGGGKYGTCQTTAPCLVATGLHETAIIEMRE